MTDSPAERYVRLGLRLGRHDDGVVDAYFGSKELAAEVDAEPLTPPVALVAQAEALLGELPDGWLRDQVAALRVYAGGLAGESRSYADEVEGCYGIRPSHTDEAVFAEAHDLLEDLFPGKGPLAERHERWRDSMLVPPQSVVSEGIGQLAPRVLLSGEGGARLAAILHEAGVAFDLPLALAVESAREPCRWAEVNAALMLHDGGAGEADTQAYLQRWGVLSPELAGHVVRFIGEPSSRTYIMNYPAGLRLCESYVDGDPHRFRRLLTEQVRVTDLTTP